jgi:hypothetical protein
LKQQAFSGFTGNILFFGADGCLVILFGQYKGIVSFDGDFIFRLYPALNFSV